MAVFTGNGSNTAPSFTFSSDTNTGMYRPGADQLSLVTNGTQSLFIDSNGDIGIGGTLPGTPNIELNADGTSFFTDHMGVGDNDYSVPKLYSNDSTDGGISFGTGWNGVSFGSLLEVVSNVNNENVVFSPLHRFQHNFSGNTNQGFIDFYRSSSLTGGYLGFGTDGTLRSILNGGGDLLIGGTLPSAPNISLETGGTLTATSFRSTGLSGAVTLPNATATTLFNVGSNVGLYIVFVWRNATAFFSASSFTATAMVMANGDSSLRLFNASPQSGSGLVIEVSGTNVQARQNTGTSQGFIRFHALRIA